MVKVFIPDGQWDIALLLETFPDFVIEEILQIPTSRTDQQDNRFWIFDSKGNYSVKDGYRLGIGLYKTPENRSKISLLKWWKFLWSLTIPPKFRIFWCKFAQDIIPTEKNLLRHHVLVPNICPLCNYNGDSTIHAVFKCLVAKALWKYWDSKDLFQPIQVDDTMQVLWWLMANLNKKEFEEFVMRGWAVWCKVMYSPQASRVESTTECNLEQQLP